MRMSTCLALSCTRPAVTAIDLDPERKGGKYAYSMEVPVCKPHYDELAAPESEWIYDTFNGSAGVAVGDGIADLNEWTITRAGKRTINKGRRYSDALTRRDLIEITLRLSGGEARKPVQFYASQEEIKGLIETLERFAK